MLAGNWVALVETRGGKVMTKCVCLPVPRSRNTCSFSYVRASMVGEILSGIEKRKPGQVVAVIGAIFLVSSVSESADRFILC